MQPSLKRLNIFFIFFWRCNVPDRNFEVLGMGQKALFNLAPDQVQYPLEIETLKHIRDMIGLETDEDLAMYPDHFQEILARNVAQLAPQKPTHVIYVGAHRPFGQMVAGLLDAGCHQFTGFRSMAGFVETIQDHPAPLVIMVSAFFQPQRCRLVLGQLVAALPRQAIIPSVLTLVNEYDLDCCQAKIGSNGVFKAYLLSCMGITA